MEGKPNEANRYESCVPRGRRYRAAPRGWRRSEVPVDPVEAAVERVRDRRLGAGLRMTLSHLDQGVKNDKS